MTDIPQNGSFASCDLLQLIPTQPFIQHTPMKTKNIDPKRCTDRNYSLKFHSNLHGNFDPLCTSDFNSCMFANGFSAL